MITYAYWFLVIALIAAVVFFVGFRMDAWKATFVVSAIILLTGGGAYYFPFQKICVKKVGGGLSVTGPDGKRHISETWKDENLWIETYDPEKNICHFSEYSKGNLLQGRVQIKNCNPLMPQE